MKYNTYRLVTVFIMMTNMFIQGSAAKQLFSQFVRPSRKNLHLTRQACAFFMQQQKTIQPATADAAPFFIHGIDASTMPAPDGIYDFLVETKTSAPHLAVRLSKDTAGITEHGLEACGYRIVVGPPSLILNPYAQMHVARSAAELLAGKHKIVAHYRDFKKIASSQELMSAYYATTQYLDALEYWSILHIIAHCSDPAHAAHYAWDHLPTVLQQDPAFHAALKA